MTRVVWVTLLVHFICPSNSMEGKPIQLPHAPQFLNVSLGEYKTPGRVTDPQARAIISPLEPQIRGRPQALSNATESIRQALDRAMEVASSDVLRGVCSGLNLRVAPLQYENMYDKKTKRAGPLMTVYSSLVLMSIADISHRVPYVYVPTALARHLITKDPVNNMIAWADYEQLSPIEREKAVAVLFDSIPHDIWITINTEISFVLGSSSCALVSTTQGYFSIVSTLVHEIMHGLGVYSLVMEEQSGGLHGHVSLFDALIQVKEAECAPSDDSCFLFNATSVQYLKGEQLAGKPLWVHKSALFNPPKFDPGSSLSHFNEPDSVMNSTISASTCRFQLTPTDIQALRYLGWDMCDPGAPAPAWTTLGTLFPAELLSTLLNTSADHSGVTGATSCHHHHEHYDVYAGHCVCDNGYHRDHDCVSDIPGLAGVVLYSIVVGCSTVALLCCCAWVCGQRGADKPGNAQSRYDKVHYDDCWDGDDEDDAQMARLFSNKPVFVIE